MNIKIILIGLVLLFSGCVETVEVPTPIPTSNALTEISDLSMDIGFMCFYDDYSEKIQHNNIIYLNFYNRYTDIEETTKIKKYDDYSVIEVYRLPQWDDKTSYFKYTTIFEYYDVCILYKQHINYTIFRAINNIVVVDKKDSYEIFPIYGLSDYGCLNSENNKFIDSYTGQTYNSMYICIDNLLFNGDFMGYKQYYPAILDKYR